jgi:L-rhamnose mutarotase
MKKYCLALDLVEDPNLISDYKIHHKNVWPEIEKSIKNTGITNLEIYCISNRLFMIIEAEDNFSFEEKNKKDINNPKVLEWETLMWKYQQALPVAKPGEKWMLMDLIYKL